LTLSSIGRLNRFFNVAVDHGGEWWVISLFKSAWTLELGFTFDDPGVGGLLAVKSLRLAVDDRAVFLDGDLGKEGFGAVESVLLWCPSSRAIINVVVVVPFVASRSVLPTSCGTT
jgi:hypothetical protein